MYDEEAKPLEGYEEVLPHVNSYEFSHIFWHQIIKEQLKVQYGGGDTKRFLFIQSNPIR